ncbi:GNAT family N-acetyltransferase [Flagellimonas meridianipacifica]|uniref:Ribosomal protein S18 acetylase RimI-like enzyme n=1 Tax=Flagellimonas meridianipacifica TaxID=1080225 RepID=A0A2T0MHF8_9FLAO|nr:N-acetyltransferase [Allomuricauda pacifica]PRX57011.1 ribosomal protein S18 acetylase RimI-like enzyme [Allomuricauda pacifica]
MELELRKCNLSDLEMLLWISKKTFEDTFETDNDPHEFRKYVAHAFTRKKLKNELQNKASDFYFVLEKDELVGYLKLNQAGAQTDVKDKNSIELERIYVLVEHQGKKFGRWMLDKAIQLSKDQKGVYFMWLGVWEHNTKAIRFYERNGFHKFGEHSFFMGKDEQTDWLMRLDFE